MNSSLPLSNPLQNPASESRSDTIQRQRREVQLLIALLKDRDKELNDRVAIYQKQFLAWEDDRQKILTLEERSSRLENELHKRNEMMSTLTRRLKALECQENDHKSTLESTQQMLHRLSRKASDKSLHCQTLEEKNQALTHSMMELSSKVRQLQAREEELLTMLSLQDNNILEVANHIDESTSKCKKLESALQEAKMEKLSMNKEKQDFKLKLKEVMLEANKLKEDLTEKTKENNTQREEIIQLKQENASLSTELMFTVETANRKDQLLFSAKAKERRTDTELNYLRQIYVQQQRDLQFLHFNLESSQESQQKQKTDLQDGSLALGYLRDRMSPQENTTTLWEKHPVIPHLRKPGGPNPRSPAFPWRASGMVSHRRSTCLQHYPPPEKSRKWGFGALMPRIALAFVQCSQKPRNGFVRPRGWQRPRLSL